jgi:serine/threonine protein phosphatase PrpC
MGGSLFVCFFRSFSEIHPVSFFCSDGLWDVFEDQQAVDMVWKYQDDKENMAKRLINEALTRGSTDNITVVVAWL